MASEVVGVVCSFRYIEFKFPNGLTKQYIAIVVIFLKDDSANDRFYGDGTKGEECESN